MLFTTHDSIVSTSTFSFLLFIVLILQAKENERRKRNAENIMFQLRTSLPLRHMSFVELWNICPLLEPENSIKTSRHTTRHQTTTGTECEKHSWSKLKLLIYAGFSRTNFTCYHDTLLESVRLRNIICLFCNLFTVKTWVLYYLSPYRALFTRPSRLCLFQLSFELAKYSWVQLGFNKSRSQCLFKVSPLRCCAAHVARKRKLFAKRNTS